jgi:hypothetical protein
MQETTFHELVFIFLAPIIIISFLFLYFLGFYLRKRWRKGPPPPPPGPPPPPSVPLLQIVATAADHLLEGAHRVAHHVLADHKRFYDAYLTQTRSPSELRVEIKRIDRELARRTNDNNPFDRAGGALEGRGLARLHLEDLYHARDLFEEHLIVPPAIAAPGKGTTIEDELTRKYKTELANGLRDRVALHKARDELLAEHPGNADEIHRLFRQKLEKLADPDL